jgi:hypothetical protein
VPGRSQGVLAVTGMSYERSGTKTPCPRPERVGTVRFLPEAGRPCTWNCPNSVRLSTIRSRFRQAPTQTSRSTRLDAGAAVSFMIESCLRYGSFGYYARFPSWVSGTVQYTFIPAFRLAQVRNPVLTSVCVACPTIRKIGLSVGTEALSGELNRQEGGTPVRYALASFRIAVFRICGARS